MLLLTKGLRVCSAAAKVAPEPLLKGQQQLSFEVPEGKMKTANEALETVFTGV